MGKSILLVEDDADVSTIICRCLEVQGYELTRTGNALQAYAAMGRRRPDLVLLDAMLPMVSGYEICEQLRRDPRTADVPVIILSARSQQFEIERGLKAGASFYLTKPFELDDLVAVVKKALPG
ncbi:MAG: response regulator [Planctomycetes bacterium]|nr:response regulator [Planctomycetota bacterium]